jgi:hypothetical protein
MSNSADPGPLEFYKQRFEIENNLTRIVLKTIPPDKLDYRPHEQSPSSLLKGRACARFSRTNEPANETKELQVELRPETQQEWDLRTY